jgi:prophage regulatory protein
MGSLLRLAKVMDMTGMGRSTLYSRIRQGLMPPPVKLGERCVAWPEHEVSAINAARMARKSDADIRALVGRLLQQRMTRA